MGATLGTSFCCLACDPPAPSWSAGPQKGEELEEEWAPMEKISEWAGVGVGPSNAAGRNWGILPALGQRREGRLGARQLLAWVYLSTGCLLPVDKGCPEGGSGFWGAGLGVG